MALYLTSQYFVETIPAIMREGNYFNVSFGQLSFKPHYCLFPYAYFAYLS